MEILSRAPTQEGRRGAGRVVTLLAIAPLVLLPLAGVRASFGAAALGLLSVAAGARLRDGQAVSVASLGIALAAASAVPVLAPLWPAPLLIALAVHAAASRVTRGTLAWARLGRIDRATGWFIAATVLASAAGLLGWYFAVEPDLADLRARVPSLPAAWLVGLGAAFAMVNAFAEEAAYRGVVMDATDAALGRGPASLLLQAGVFGVIHLHGFPRGAPGVLLAAGYGLLLGVLRRRSGGLLAPWLAHVCADLVIFAVLAAISA